MHVVHLMRKPQAGYHSFERLFAAVRLALPGDIEVTVVHCRYPTRGLFPRLGNLLQALFIRADVVHITGDINYLAPALVGRRVVLTVHDLAPLYAKQGWRHRLFRWLWYTLPFKVADRVTAVSACIRDELVEHARIVPDAVAVIPNCISPEFTHVPKAWPDKPVVLIVGTKPQKNIERMLTALQGMNVRVRIVGPLTSAQRELIDATGVPCDELGCLSDEALLQAYRDCDCLAFASTYEGFGLPVAEAQATGRPVLTSDLPTFREVAGEGGACFVDPLDIASIRQGFGQLLQDDALRRSLVERGLENARRFTPKATAEAYAEVYREAGGRRLET